jgi:hypothetical protein
MFTPLSLQFNDLTVSAAKSGVKDRLAAPRQHPFAHCRHREWQFKPACGTTAPHLLAKQRGCQNKNPNLFNELDLLPESGTGQFSQSRQ